VTEHNQQRCDFRVAGVTTAYNCVDTIGRTIQRVIDQTVSVNEIVIVDDGAYDDTISAVQNLTRRFNGVRPMQQTNGGPSKAKNTGVEHSNFEYEILMRRREVQHSQLDKRHRRFA